MAFPFKIPHIEPMTTKPKRPRDPNVRAKLIVDIATGAFEDRVHGEAKDQKLSEYGQRGGSKGGPARAKKLTKKQRTEIARKAANARWKKDKRN